MTTKGVAIAKTHSSTRYCIKSEKALSSLLSRSKPKRRHFRSYCMDITLSPTASRRFRFNKCGDSQRQSRISHYRSNNWERVEQKSILCESIIKLFTSNTISVESPATVARMNQWLIISDDEKMQMTNDYQSILVCLVTPLFCEVCLYPRQYICLACWH